MDHPCLSIEYEIPPKNEVPKGEVPPNRMKIKVHDGEMWETFAQKYNIDVEKLIYLNFQTNDHREVNWYLHHHVGCNLPTEDHKNWRFSTTADPGYILVPKPAEPKFPIPTGMQLPPSVDPPELPKQVTPLDRYWKEIKGGKLWAIKGAARLSVHQTSPTMSTIILYALPGVSTKPATWDNGINKSLKGQRGESHIVRKCIQLRRELQEYYYWKEQYIKAFGDLHNDRSKEKQMKAMEVGRYMKYAMENAHDLAVEINAMATHPEAYGVTNGKTNKSKK